MAKSSKRALLLSALAIVLCIAMLIGTTFAWFTDTASTAVNRIQSGSLKVGIIDIQGNSLEGKQLKWQAADGREQDEILWEPGCTYYLAPFQIQNKGSLALKYKVVINGVSGDSKLLEALEFGFYYFWVGFGEERSLDELIEGGKLDNVAEYPGLCTAPIYIVAHMRDDAGNEYQGLSIDGIGITVVATQDTYENDSFNNQYDKDATYPVTDNKGLKDAINNATDGSTVLITSGEYTLSDPAETSKIEIPAGATIAGTTFRGTKITNAFRGIQFWSLSGDSVIDNCVLDVAGYTFNIDAAEAGSTLTITNSTLNGWTSYTSGIDLVTFDSCKLGLNAYSYLRPYSETKLVNCEFTSDGYQLNAGGLNAYTITLTNCTKNGTPITADNVKTLLLDMDDWNSNATLIVNGVTVSV